MNVLAPSRITGSRNGVICMTKNWKLKVAAAALALSTMMTSTSASALSFVFTDTDGSVAGTPAEAGFRAAANFWSSIITNRVTVRFNIGYTDLGPNVLGSTGSTLTIRSIQGAVGRIAGLGSNSAVDQQVRATGLPNLTPGQIGGLGAVDVVTPDYVDVINQLGIDTTSSVLDTDGSFNNSAIAISTANAKALGYFVPDSVSDATINFSSTFAFDFDGSDGITAGQLDFVGVAIHEIGHALGFISGVDDYDVLGCPNGPGCAAFSDYAVNDDYWGYALDLFRYNAKGNLDWRPGVDAYFSLDQGASQYGGNSVFSTGNFNGDGFQASHWNSPDQSPFCSGLIGIMNPYLCGGRDGFVRNAIITSQDIAAFDAIGWNFHTAATAANFSRSTANLTVSVPEPASWALMLGGFFAIGTALRRRSDFVVRKSSKALSLA
jgi:hypothetical protein